MSNQTVPFDGQARERAIALLAAAEQLDLSPTVVESRTGAFSAPAEVVEKAGLSDAVPQEESSLSEDSADDDKPRRGRAKSTTKEK